MPCIQPGTSLGISPGNPEGPAAGKGQFLKEDGVKLLDAGQEKPVDANFHLLLGQFLKEDGVKLLDAGQEKPVDANFHLLLVSPQRTLCHSYYPMLQMEKVRLSQPRCTAGER